MFGIWLKMSISTDHSKLEENSLDKESVTKLSFPGICCAEIIILLSIHYSHKVLGNEFREGDLIPPILLM